MTVHSGIFGPVHTGILSGIELFGALRLQRRLEPCSTTSATGPSRCVPPPCGTTAPPKSGAPPSARTGPFLLTSSRLRPVRAQPPATVCGLPFVVDYAAVGATLARRCPGWDQPALGWESLGGRFFRVPSFVLVGSVSLVSWAVLRGLSPRRRVAVTSVASPAFCSLCCLGSPRLPQTQIEATV